MSSKNGAIPRMRVRNHLLDDVAFARERIAQIDEHLQASVALYRHDKADDPVQEQEIESLQAMKDREEARLRQLVEQVQSLESGDGLTDQPYRLPGNGDDASRTLPRLAGTGGVGALPPSGPVPAS